MNGIPTRRYAVLTRYAVLARQASRGRYLAVAALAAVAALVEVPVEYGRTHSATESLQALAAVAIAGAVAALAVSILTTAVANRATAEGASTDATPRVGGPTRGLLGGLAFGGFFVGAAITSWTYGAKVWGVLLFGGIGFAVWSFPWLRHLRQSLGLGGAWLGVGYWLLGMVGAGLVWHPTVAAQRLLYAGIFGLAVLAVLAGTRTLGNGNGWGLSVGVAVAFLLAIAALLVAGAGNLFDPVHVVVPNAWGVDQFRRFWGGRGLLYHPNSLAGIAVAVAIRIGPDRRFTPWQRLAATILAGWVVIITNSRSGYVFLGTAAAVHAVLLWWRHRQPRNLFADLPDYPGRRVWWAAAAPFAVLAAVTLVSGPGFLSQNRYEGGGVTSGRTATWAAVGHDWQRAGIAEKLFGDARTARAVVRRADAPNVDLTTDNAAVGALRRGGVLGVVAFLLGLWLLFAHAFRRRTPLGPGAPAWLPVAAVAMIPTIAFADWFLGGTGGTLWVLLLTGEAAVLTSRS